MGRLLLQLVLFFLLCCVSEGGDGGAIRCVRSPRGCGFSSRGGGGGGDSIERIYVVGSRLPSFRNLLPMISSHHGINSNNEGRMDGGSGRSSGGSAVSYYDVSKLKVGAKGEKIVVEVLKNVENVLGTTNGLLLKIALVESKFGKHPDTFRAGYNGGIFQVDLIGFQDTQNVASHPGLTAKFVKIENAFGINWRKATWQDLRKPLYSAIAARLYLSNKPGVIPTASKAQAKYWKDHYNSNHENAGGTALKFEKRWNEHLKSKQQNKKKVTGGSKTGDRGKYDRY